MNTLKADKPSCFKQIPVSATFFECNVTVPGQPFAHFFEHTIGSDHATIALRADWQKQLLRCHKELGTRYVRFHGILSDDMGTLVDEIDQLVYSFFNADQVFDYLVSIGMRPFVELSFMPLCLSSGDTIVFHYKGNVTPPRDYQLWANLVSKLAAHWVNRYGIDEVSQWFFEVWNEPNLSAFWTGSQADYFKLYQYSATAIKAVNPLLQVGGPATANNGWIEDFLNFCEESKTPVDFISTHHYPTDAFGQPGDDTITQLSKSRRSVLQEEARQVKREARAKPVYYTEWCTSSNPFDELHDLPYAAAFIIKTVMEANGLVEGYSYWTFSDIFEENYFNSIPFHGGFGLLTIYGTPKPSYRAYQLLHALGTEIFPVSGQHETVDVWIVRKGGSIQVLITNWALPLHDIKTEIVGIRLTGCADLSAGYMERIDETHANSYRAWQDMGSPGSLSGQQVAQLDAISEIKQEPIYFCLDQGTLSLTVDVPPQGVVCITLMQNG